MGRRLVLVAVLVLRLGMMGGVDPVQAEWYLAGQGGQQIPQDLTNIRGTGNFTGVTSNNLNLRTQWAYGVKAGYIFSDAWNWLAVEFDFPHSDANVERQGITAGAPILGTTQQSGMTPRVGLTVNHMTGHVIARYPGGFLQPYVGVGGGLGHSLLRTAPEAESAFYPVFSVLAGMKLFVTEHVALFGEYTYARATVEFSDNQFNADLRTNWFMGGVAYHF
ncbi:MAG: hypothetical protein RL768_1214 [Nitrospirota bacterium]|jgi:opacity protein-like surface antigen